MSVDLIIGIWFVGFCAYCLYSYLKARRAS